MRPEDETPPESPPEGDENAADATDHAGEHEVLPATFAGRRRAAAESGSGAETKDAEKADADETGADKTEPDKTEADKTEADAALDLRAGFSEEFDSIERDLDR